MWSVRISNRPVKEIGYSTESQSVSQSVSQPVTWAQDLDLRQQRRTGQGQRHTHCDRLTNCSRLCLCGGLLSASFIPVKPFRLQSVNTLGAVKDL